MQAVQLVPDQQQSLPHPNFYFRTPKKSLLSFLRPSVTEMSTQTLPGGSCPPRW